MKMRWLFRCDMTHNQPHFLAITTIHGLFPTYKKIKSLHDSGRRKYLRYIDKLSVC